MQALRKMTKRKNGGSVEGSGSKMQDGGRTLSVLTGRTERDLMGRRGCFAQDAVRRNVEGRGLGGEGDRRSGGNGVRGGGMTGGKVVLRSSNGGGYGGLRRRQRRRRQESGTDEQ